MVPYCSRMVCKTKRPVVRVDARDAQVEVFLLRPGGDLLGVLGPQGLDLFLAAGVGLDEIGADGLIGSAEGQQDEHGGHARAVLAAGAVEQHRRFTGFQRPEQLFVGLVAVEHPLVHGPGHPVALVGHPFQQGEAVFRGEIHFFAVFEAEAADLHQPGTVRHIVRGRGGFGAAAQVKDEAEAQAVQQLAVRRAGQAGRGDAAVDLPPFDVLALVGLIAAQLPEVVSARKGRGVPGAGCTGAAVAGAVLESTGKL